MSTFRFRPLLQAGLLTSSASFLGDRNASQVGQVGLELWRELRGGVL